MATTNPAARLQICKQCPYFNKLLSTCKKCGCAMKSKVMNKNAKCPLRKW